ncbi:MAG: hypothetical protein OEY49_15235 [Candidatus Heimdallarchaeota archaeon]|nr:hypothetical protein [Candidatus Heimdallarchaeota archaeon]
MKFKQKYHSNKGYVILVLIFILLNLNYSVSQPNLNNIDNDQVPPNIKIIEFELNDTLPDDGDTVGALIKIKNEDSSNYTNLRLQLTITELLSERRTNEPIELSNEIIENIAVDEIIIIEVSFTVYSGQYMLNAIIFYNNFPINDSVVTRDLQVRSPPFGDNITPLVALIILIIFVILFLFIQAFYDYMRLKRSRRDN